MQSYRKRYTWQKNGRHTIDINCGRRSNSTLFQTIAMMYHFFVENIIFFGITFRKRLRKKEKI